MIKHWKKYLWRNGLFTFSRDALIFFVNLFAWSQGRDLKAIALFNIIYLSTHLAMFFVFLPLLNAGHGQKIMKTGLIGLAGMMGLVLWLESDVLAHLNAAAFGIGFFNGMYWLVNHVEALHISDNKNRTSFLSYRKAIQGAAKLAMPALGWAVFAILDNDVSGYNVIYAVALVAMLVAAYLTEINIGKEKDNSLRGAWKSMRKTKGTNHMIASVFFYGLAIRGPLSVIVLPFLIFQVVDQESGLNAIQTIIELIAIVAAVIFGSFKRNTHYVERLMQLAAGVSIIGLVAMIMELNLTSYLLYSGSYIVALTAINIGQGTAVNNYVTTMMGDKHWFTEYVVIREPIAIFGFLVGYFWLYFNPELSLENLRPLLILTLAGVIINYYVSTRLWRIVKHA